MIKAILPRDNVFHKIKTYGRLTRLFNFPKVTERKFCMICHETVDFKESCPNPNCLAQKAKAQYKDVKEPMITEFDYVKDLKDISRETMIKSSSIGNN